MAQNTGIEWCDYTFNPWWGCTLVSPGCQHCYAEVWTKRYGYDVWGRTAPRRFFGEAHWREPRRWNRAAKREERRARVFCASMADVFDDHPHVVGERQKLWSLVESPPTGCGVGASHPRPLSLGAGAILFQAMAPGIDAETRSGLGRANLGGISHARAHGRIPPVRHPWRWRGPSLAFCRMVCYT